MFFILGVIFTLVGLVTALIKQDVESDFGAVVFVFGIILLIFSTGGRW